MTEDHEKPAAKGSEQRAAAEQVAIELVLPDRQRLVLVGRAVEAPDALITVEIEPSPVNPQSILSGLSKLAAAQSAGTLARADVMTSASDPDNEDWRLASHEAIEASGEFSGEVHTERLLPPGTDRGHSPTDPADPDERVVTSSSALLEWGRKEHQSLAVPGRPAPAGGLGERKAVKRRHSTPLRGGAAAEAHADDARRQARRKRAHRPTEEVESRPGEREDDSPRDGDETPSTKPNG